MSDIIVRVDGWDLVKDGGQEEPRIRDFDLAERLQYRELKAIRKLIKRLIDAGFLPNICVRDTVSRTQMPTGGVRETVEREYLLTEEEVLGIPIAAWADTRRMRAVRRRRARLAERATGKKE